ncbi:DUF4365 domain-containing protein [Actinospica sp. MGRD01-02]|uniref:DUF4365 domain-containing protein n=2 Tax=Actinospica acidithermotolerans TaxID=2828514 RepID=A0A941EDD4_9ACTN|nr:DUF4365 domain-containing protein [Actinospica acidithermotolerans]
MGTETATLSATAAKGRFGVAYMRAVCSQAGVGFDETEPDGDVLAVDGTIWFAEGPVRVQLKCTGQFRIDGGTTASWEAKPEWREKWNRCLVPVYFVIVMLDPDEQAAWLRHHDTGTHLTAAAFWVRVNQTSESGSVTVPKSQRLHAETLTLWRDDVISGHLSSGSGVSI